MSAFGVYVHWPYCAAICPYCDFNVYRARGRDPAPLLKAVADDIAAHRDRIGPRQTASVFFGGGTPSLLAPAALEALLAAINAMFPLAPGCEITLEANPEDAGAFAGQAAAGINRFSVGVQALDDSALKALGRWHDAATAIAAVRAAAATGARVSMDLIYAREGQSIDDWKAELTAALALPVEHLSLYQLTIEAGTAFDRAVKRGRMAPPGPALAADFYEVTQAVCTRAGMPAYEISNHARSPAAQSVHNALYWRSAEWVGVGPGAHGRVFQGGQRVATLAHARPQDYIDSVAANGVGWSEAEPLDPRTVAEEQLMMGLRLLQHGATIAPLEAAFGAPLRTATLIDEGLIAVRDGAVSLTARGQLLADRIAGALLPT